MRVRTIMGVILSSVVLLAWSGCASARLEPAAFEGRTIAATASIPPAPVVDHPLLAWRERYRVPARARDEKRDLERLQTRLRQVAPQVDMPAIIAGELLLAGAEDLGARVTDSPATADYVLDFRVHHYGLRMRSFESYASFMMEAEARLIHRETKEPVWTKRLRRARDFELNLTGDELASLSDAAFADVLEGVAARTAALMKEVLQQSIADVR